MTTTIHPAVAEAATVIEFDLDGSLTLMQTDRVDLSGIGRQSVRRASEIEWNESAQQWEIALYLYNDDGVRVGSDTHPKARGFPGYEAARKAEVRWLNACRWEGAEPLSERGLELLEESRNTLGYPLA